MKGTRSLRGLGAAVAWIVATTMVALPAGRALGQIRTGVQSGLQSNVQTGAQSGVQSGLRSGFDHRPSYNYRSGYRPAYSNCWRVTRTRRGRIVWNCQPFPPP